MTYNKDNSGHEYVSAASDADVRVAIARSDRSAAKVVGLDYKFVTLNQKVKLEKMHMVKK